MGQSNHHFLQCTISHFDDFNAVKAAVEALSMALYSLYSWDGSMEIVTQVQLT